jgi:hypothetical protein
VETFILLQCSPLLTKCNLTSIAIKVHTPLSVSAHILHKGHLQVLVYNAEAWYYCFSFSHMYTQI